MSEAVRPVVVLGGTGQLGRALQQELRARGRPVLAPARSELDLQRIEDIPERIESMRPHAVINAAAFNDVAGAELDRHREEVFRLNRDVPGRLAEAARRLGAPFVHVSTDYVFDGTRERPYRESDSTAPLQVYGESKLLGEQTVLEAYPEALVARTSTLYGHGRERPHYVDAILARARHRDALEVVRLPISSPTYATDLAAGLLELLRVGAGGVVHVVNAGECSRLELARESVRLAGLGDRVEVRERPEPPDDPRRPAYSVLDTSRFAALTGGPLRSWNEALRDYIRRAPGV